MTVDLKWRGGKASHAVGKASEGATREAAEKILAEANKRVPYEYGDLERSAGVREYRKVLYIFYDQPYAVRLHENPQYNFRRGRRGKWLQRTLTDNFNRILGWIGDPWKRIFSGFGRP